MSPPEHMKDGVEQRDTASFSGNRPSLGTPRSTRNTSRCPSTLRPSRPLARRFEPWKQPCRRINQPRTVQLHRQGTIGKAACIPSELWAESEPGTMEQHVLLRGQLRCCFILPVEVTHMRSAKAVAGVDGQYVDGPSSMLRCRWHSLPHVPPKRRRPLTT